MLTWLCLHVVGNHRRACRPAAGREVFEHEGVVGRADGLDFMHEAGGNLGALAVGDHRDRLVRLHAEADANRVAGAGCELEIKCVWPLQSQSLPAMGSDPSEFLCSGAGPLESGLCLRNHVVDNFLEVAAFREDLRAGGPRRCPARAWSGCSRSRSGCRVRPPRRRRTRGISRSGRGRHFGLLAEVDQLAVEAVARGAPLVLHDQRAAVDAGSSGCARAACRASRWWPGTAPRSRCVSSSAHRDVADAELERREERMRADVPPDLLGVVDAVGLDQQVDEVFVLGPAGESVGDVGARELVEDLAAIGLAGRYPSRARTASWWTAPACAAGSSAPFMRWMATSRSSMPMCTCRPKIRFARATIFRSSTIAW